MSTKADQEDVVEDEIVELEDEAAEVEGDQEGQPEDEQSKTEGDGESEGEGEDLIVSIGDEGPQEEQDQTHAPEWVRDLRKTNRELQRQNRELQAKLQTSPEAKPAALGAKPKLEDFDYDADQFESALSGWFERKRQADAEAEKIAQAEKAQQQAWQSKLESYGKAKSDLKVKDFEDAEESVQSALSVTQQGIILQGADNPALIVYALYKNQKKAKELAAIQDPVKFSFAVAKLEKDLKVTKRKAAPPPEKTVSGTGRSSGAIDSTLERLRQEAARTGDMTKVMQYKASKKK